MILRFSVRLSASNFYGPLRTQQKLYSLSQEVHLQQAQLLDGVLRVLGRQVPILHRDGDDVRQWPVGDDHAARMLTAVAHHAFDDAAGLDDAGGGRVAADFGPQFVGLLERVFERDVDVVGDQLGQAIGFDERQVADAGEVADHHLGAEGAERDDVGDAVGAVLPAHVVDDLIAAAHAEVDVEVGRGDAFGIEEALEEQPEADRVDVGDLQAIGDDGASARAAARADGDVLAPRPIDEVPDDEEVVDETRAGDDAQLVVDAAAELGGTGLSRAGNGFVGLRLRVVVVDAIAFLEAEFDDLEEVRAVGPHPLAGVFGDGEIALLAGGHEQAVLELLVAVQDGVRLLRDLGLHAFREDVDRVMVLADGQLHIAHLGDLDGVGDGLGHFGEDAAHFGFGLQVEFLRRILHAALIREAGAGLDAQHRVVRDVIGGIDVVYVVGRDDT